MDVEEVDEVILPPKLQEIGYERVICALCMGMVCPSLMKRRVYYSTFLSFPISFLVRLSFNLTHPAGT